MFNANFSIILQFTKVFTHFLLCFLQRIFFFIILNSRLLSLSYIFSNFSSILQGYTAFSYLITWISVQKQIFDSILWALGSWIKRSLVQNPFLNCCKVGARQVKAKKLEFPSHWTSWAQEFEPTSANFPGMLTENWTITVVAETQTGTLIQNRIAASGNLTGSSTVSPPTLSFSSQVSWIFCLATLCTLTFYPRLVFIP